MPARLDPFTLVFGALAEERFPALTASLASANITATDRDAFILDRAVTELLRDLVPDDAPSDALHEFIAVLQHCFLYWAEGRITITSSADLPALPFTARAPQRPSAYYQLPSHLYWAQLDADDPHEPLDGFFVHATPRGLRALAIFGLHPERPGFSVAEIEGAAPSALRPRPDGSAPFAPLMEGGAAAGLRSVAGPDELLALAWHALSPEPRAP